MSRLCWLLRNRKSPPFTSPSPLCLVHLRPSIVTNINANPSTLVDTTVRKMHVLSIPMFHDNYAYVIYDPVSKEAAVVDPADPTTTVPALQALAKAESEGGKGLILNLILNTHHHHDHSGGNDEMMAAFPSATLIAGHSSPTDSAVNPTDRSAIRLSNSITITPLFTPCHTLDSISYHITDSSSPSPHPSDRTRNSTTTTISTPSAVFTGDTLFHAGCGRFFEGSASQMHDSLNKTLSSISPPSTLVFPGHEYTRSNIKWALSVLPTDPHLLESSSYLSDPETITSNGAFTIEDEKKHNLFMRVDDPVVQKAVNATDPVEVMNILRNLKNQF